MQTVSETDAMLALLNRRESFFVYVGAGRHLWRFVFFARAARDGDDAIAQATREAVELGNSPAGEYLAVPASACTTAKVL